MNESDKIVNLAKHLVKPGDHAYLGAYTEAIADAKARIEALVREAEKKVWLELKRGDGLYTNESGCREVHIDYINDRIAALDTPKPTEEKS